MDCKVLCSCGGTVLGTLEEFEQYGDLLTHCAECGCPLCADCEQQYEVRCGLCAEGLTRAEADEISEPGPMLLADGSVDHEWEADPDFTPTDGQSKALDLAAKLTKADSTAVGIIRGYAGTGKTTVLRELIRRLGCPVLLAPTGKAALRIQEATGKEARTIHSWLYAPIEDDKGEVYFERKHFKDLDIGTNRLVVIDEASMIQRDVWEDVLSAARSLQLNVLLIGDGFQLPPVESRAEIEKNHGPFSVLADNFPNAGRVDLTEIMRQALGSPIIRGSLALRQGDLYAFKKALPASDGATTRAAIAWASTPGNDGCVICHTNAYRHSLNAQIRAGFGKGTQIEAGEPLLVLKNNYRLGRFNGEVIPFYGWKAVSESMRIINYFEHDREPFITQFGVADLGGARALISVARLFGHGEGFPAKIIASSAHKANFGKSIDKEDRLSLPFLDCCLGYTLTAHKSQGSQWKKVVVIVEPSVRAKTVEGRRWLYTAVTRSVEDVTLYWK
jgi:hypothetical protein